MPAKEDLSFSVRNKIQHHVLNWIVISRYRMVHCGIPKDTTQRYLVKIEKALRKINVIK